MLKDEMWAKIYHLAATILKIGPGVSKILAKNHIFEHGSLWLGKFILWKKLGEKGIFDLR